MHIKEALLERVQETFLRFVRAFDLQRKGRVYNLKVSRLQLQVCDQLVYAVNFPPHRKDGIFDIKATESLTQLTQKQHRA